VPEISSVNEEINVPLQMDASLHAFRTEGTTLGSCKRRERKKKKRERDGGESEQEDRGAAFGYF